MKPKPKPRLTATAMATAGARVRVRVRVPLAVGLLWAAALAGPAEAHKPTVTTFTFHADIYPIFSAKCGACHRAGGVAPMSLLVYEEAYPWAVSIKNEVLNLAMPPWPADERYGAFKHAGGLSPTEMNTIVDWCLGGTPEGAAPEVPAAKDDGWALGPPDLELVMEAPVTLTATENERRERVVVGPVPRDVFLRALDVRPGAPNIVRSALVLTGDRLAFAWTPGSTPEPFPAASGLPLPAGTEIVLEVQYAKTWLDEGTEVEDRSTVGLYFADDVTRNVEPLSVASDGAGLLLDSEVEVVSLLPNVTSRDEAFVAEIVRPDGTREPIIRLRDPSPEFVRTYWLETPLLLESGTRIESSHPLVLSVVRD